MLERRHSTTARLAICLAAVVLAGVTGAQAAASDGAKPPAPDFLGQAVVPTGTTFAGTTVGGLSSISYDQERAAFYALSDDQSQFQPRGSTRSTSTSPMGNWRPAMCDSMRSPL
jgi:hypothetical protein